MNSLHLPWQKARCFKQEKIKSSTKGYKCQMGWGEGLSGCQLTLESSKHLHSCHFLDSLKFTGGGRLFFVYFWKLSSFLHKMHKSWQVCRKMQSMSSLKEMCATEIKIAILNIFICYCLVNSPCSVFAFEKLQSAFWFELGKYFCSVQNFQFPLKLLKLVLFIRELTKICK